MTDYDVIVIGAGNAGLTAATSLALKGTRVILLERHNIPGGCATSFCRGRFEFEVSLHQLSGLGTAKSPGPLRATLNSLGVLDKLHFVEMRDLYRVIMPGRLDVTLRANRNEAVQELQKKFPAEKEAIASFFDFVYKFFQEVIGAFYLNDPEISRQKYPLFFQYALADSQSILDKYFQDPLLKLALSVYWTYMGVPPRHLPFSDLAALLFAYIEFRPFHMKGGSQMLSNTLLDQLLRHGGTARFNCAVERILVKDGAVRGVKTEQGDEITARCVLSNASPIATYIEMMDRDEVPEPLITQMRSSTVGTSFFTIYMGFDCDPSELGITETTNFICATTDSDRDYTESKRLECDESSFIISCYDVSDPDFSPPGTCQAALVTMKYAEPWLRLPPSQYASVKYRCAEQLLARSEEVFPGLWGHLEEMEIATPITHMRYLGHPGGGPYGFDQYAKDSTMFVSPKPPIVGLYGAGAWYGSAGYQPTLMSGASAARAILKELKA
ncbi:MAG: NAD(P)/FAD-dependent oxidoreductase [Spirochaetes bacterium]|nr:NAD(P)/FAD-dependent oxidoreductase [Spirochaetota bacterium]